MLRRYLAFILLIFSSPILALDNVLLSLDSLDAQAWKLAGIKISLSDLNHNPQQLALSVQKLSLPKPFNDVSLVNIHCTDFSWQNQELLCKQGKASVHSKHWQSPTANFSFHIKDHDNSLGITGLRIAGGKANIMAAEQDGQWQLSVYAEALDANVLGKLFASQSVELKSGWITIKLDAEGSQTLANGLHVDLSGHGLTGQVKDGQFAAEGTGFKASLDAKRADNDWRWQSHATLDAGAVYVEPVYLEAKQAVSLDGQGLWQQAKQHLRIDDLRYHHANVGEVEGWANLDLKKGLSIESAQLAVSSADLEKLSTIYLQPFLAQTALEGLTLAGQARGDLTVIRDSMSAVNAVFNQVAINDPKARVTAQGGNGVFNWSDQESFNQPSTLAWHKLALGRVPVAAAKLEFLAKANSLRLLKPTVLPLLDGSFTIKQLSWQGRPGQEPDVAFAGALNQVSLEQLTKALDWTPLSGSITGAIPTIQYSNKTLSLGGELLVKVFSGDIRVSNFAASGLFTSLPKFYSDLEINHLDMEQLTGKFKFGGITGKLSGYVRQLYMENWQPVSFYAWFGTPDDDNSKHRISQKAVNNIASIGGGGASDLVSRSVLGLFETFGYDKIGLGCYLHDGVCQLMGLEATPLGYSIIKGGGLPRIDVIGYNPRVDWDVLLDRLKRITASDEVIVK